MPWGLLAPSTAALVLQLYITFCTEGLGYLLYVGQGL